MKRINCLFIMMIAVLLLTFPVIAAEKENEVNVGEAYGSIYGIERNPSQGDTSKWLTIQNGDSGVRIVTKDGKEIVAVDNYGGIYLNGDLYLNDSKLTTQANSPVYFIILVCMLINLIVLVKYKNIKKEILELRNGTNTVN